MTNGEVVLLAINGMGGGMAMFRALSRSSRCSLNSRRWSSTVDRVTHPSSATAAVVELHGGYRSSATQRACLVTSWGHGESLGGR